MVQQNNVLRTQLLSAFKAHLNYSRAQQPVHLRGGVNEHTAFATLLPSLFCNVGPLQKKTQRTLSAQLLLLLNVLKPQLQLQQLLRRFSSCLVVLRNTILGVVCSWGGAQLPA
jgi:hypothetical protein